MSKINELLNYNEEMNTLFTNNVWKQLDTGRLVRHYRANASFIVRETVIIGFKKKFIDSIDVFTNLGYHIGKLYRIRETEWSRTSTNEIVSRLLNEYLYSANNLVYLNDIISEIYDKQPNAVMIQEFITRHEK